MVLSSILKNQIKLRDISKTINLSDFNNYVDNDVRNLEFTLYQAI